jgi:hypothetical protein
MLRIRDSATVTPLDIQEDKLKYLRGNLDSKKVGHMAKDRAMKGICGMCCICGQISTQIVTIHLEDVKKLERYCDICIQGFYEHEKEVL